MISRFLAGSALALVLAGTAFAEGETNTATEGGVAEAASELNADTVLAVVNGEEITLGHVIALTSRLPERFQALPDADLYQGVLEQLIQQSALAEGMDRDTRSVQLAIENEVRALLATEKLKAVEEAAVTEEAVQAAYEQKYANAPTEQEWRAQHILVQTEDEAKAIVEELKAGADFTELAKQKSTGPSGPAGGDLGWQGKGRLVKPFEDAMTALEPGEISEPVQTQFGWHVIKLNEVREKPRPTLEEVRPEIERELKEAAVQKALQEAAQSAKIERIEQEIDPSVIRRTDLLK